MDVKNQINYWLTSAEHDLDTAQTLFDVHKYDWCLYIAHLVIEKILKALYVKNNKQIPPKTHKLHILAEQANLKLTTEQTNFLQQINEFNIEARYPDVKFNFYRLCSQDFTTEYFEKIKELRDCLLKKI